jgi:hypothetical protein
MDWPSPGRGMHIGRMVPVSHYNVFLLVAFDCEFPGTLSLGP